MGSGAAGSWSINNLGPRIVAGNFEPGFFVEHFIKDLGIALSEARRMGLSLPGLALANQLYLAVQVRAAACRCGVTWRRRRGLDARARRRSTLPCRHSTASAADNCTAHCTCHYSARNSVLRR